MEIILRNGETLKQALSKVGEYKEPRKYLQDKYPYYKIGEYVERLNQVFGIDGYEVAYSSYESIVLPGRPDAVNQVIGKADCTISLFGEKGDVVYRANGIGTKELSRDKEKTQYQLLNNNGLFVQQAAFKSACKSMNIFDCNRYEEDGDGSGHIKTSTASSKKEDHKGNRDETSERSNGKDNNTKREKVISFYKTASLEKIRVDQQTDLPVYRFVGHEVVGKTCREKPSEVIMYPNCYKKETSKMNQLIECNRPGAVLLRVGDGVCSDTERFENTYIFKGFGGN